MSRTREASYIDEGRMVAVTMKAVTLMLIQTSIVQKVLYSKYPSTRKLFYGEWNFLSIASSITSLSSCHGSYISPCCTGRSHIYELFLNVKHLTYNTIISKSRRYEYKLILQTGINRDSQTSTSSRSKARYPKITTARLWNTSSMLKVAFVIIMGAYRYRERDLSGVEGYDR